MANCVNLLPSQHQWPVGFRFYPTDEELIDHYLKNKVLGNESLVAFICHIDVCNYEPSDLPGLLNDHTGIEKWVFFSALDFKNSNSNRSNRITKTGFWKSTGNDRKIMARGTNELIGRKKTLVFHRGRARNSNRTNWVIHEYRLHTDTSFANLRPLVICRLKKKSDVNVLKFDEPNGLVNSTFENAGTANGIQESSPPWHSSGQPALPDSQSINAFDGGVNRKSRQSEATEQNFNLLELLRLCSSPRQPALPDFQPINASDGGASRESILPEATENYFNLSDLLNSNYQPMDASDEYFDDATTSKPCSEPEPALRNFQSANGNGGEVDPIDYLYDFVEDVNYDGEVNNQQLRPGASECEFNDCLNSIRENDDEVTSRVCNDSYTGPELQYGEFDAARQNNPITPSWFHNYKSSSMQNMQTMESGGSNPIVKYLQYKVQKGNSCVLSFEGEARMLGISMDGDNSEQLKSKDVVSYGSASKTVRLKREIRSKAISQHKAKEDEKRMEVVSSSQLSITDSNDGLKSEAGNKATNCGVSCCGSIASTRIGFSYIVTTKRIQHMSTHPLVYVAKAFLGIIMFVVLAQEVLPF